MRHVPHFKGAGVMVVHGSAVLLYLGFLTVVARSERRRAKRALEAMRAAGPCWVSRDS